LLFILKLEKDSEFQKNQEEFYTKANLKNTKDKKEVKSVSWA